ncbi:MAG: histidine kinase [Omnitrophica WOR_2 bacterium]
MSDRHSSDRFTTHMHRLVILLSLLLIVNVGLRRRNDLAVGYNIELMLVLLGIYTALYASEPFLSRRIKIYRFLYFPLQFIIVQSLGIFQEYQDTWALLYIPLGFQAATRCSRKEAVAWFGLFITSLLVTLSVEFGVISGLGRALAYTVIGTLLISYDAQYAQHEDALAESQLLVSELKEAHNKLVDYAAQAEKLAAMQEHDRMVQQLYDAVGQKIFATQLAAETTRLMLENEPERAKMQIEELNKETQSTLGQMRQLIDQWRPA